MDAQHDVGARWPRRVLRHDVGLPLTRVVAAVLFDQDGELVAIDDTPGYTLLTPADPDPRNWLEEASEMLWAAVQDLRAS